MDQDELVKTLKLVVFSVDIVHHCSKRWECYGLN